MSYMHGDSTLVRSVHAVYCLHAAIAIRCRLISPSQALPTADVECDPQSSTARETSSLKVKVVRQRAGVGRQAVMSNYVTLDSAAANRCTRAVTRFLACETMPHNLVEREGFRKMVTALNPRYELPHRKFFANNSIPALYNEVREQLGRLMKVEAQFVALTTDAWTSAATQPFVAVTCHFIDTNWNLKSVCLACSLLTESHTAENLAENMRNVLNDWSLNVANVTCCTTDNAANVVNSITYLKVCHLPCFGHTVNIGVNHALDRPDVKEVITKVHAIQRLFSHSWSLQRDLFEAQTAQGCPKAKLPSDVPTRWWSSLKLLDRVVDHNTSITKVLLAAKNTRHRYLVLVDSDLCLLEKLIRILKPLRAFSDTLCGEEYVTASCVLPVLQKIKQLLSPEPNDTVALQEVKECIVNALVVRYEDRSTVHDLLLICTFMDPRFKVHRAFTAEHQRSMRVLVRRQVMAEVEVIGSLGGDSQSSGQPVGQATATKKSKIGGLGSIFADDDMETITTLSSDEKVDAEMEMYASTPRLAISDNNSDCLAWWRHNKDVYPLLAVVARKFLCVPGSSVPSERVFSTSGQVMTSIRSALKPDKAEMQVFLAKNKAYF
jgi:hypothetical protein